MVQEEDTVGERRHYGHSSRPATGLGFCQREPGGRGSKYEGCQGGREERKGLDQGCRRDREELQGSCRHLDGEWTY